MGSNLNIAGQIYANRRFKQADHAPIFNEGVKFDGGICDIVGWRGYNLGGDLARISGRDGAIDAADHDHQPPGPDSIQERS